MEIKNKIKLINEYAPAEEQVLFCLLLTFVGGFFDAYTYVNSNGIFANAQTGNMIFIALDLAEGKYNKSLHYVLPIISFVLGVIVNEYLIRRFSRVSVFRYLYITITVQVAMLFFIYFIPSIYGVDIRPVVISFVCSMQFHSFRKINNRPFASIFCTGNLRSASEFLFKYLANKDKKYRNEFFIYSSIIIVFFIGVIIGGIISKYINHKAILIPIAVMIASIIFMVVLQIRLNNATKHQYSLHRE